MFQSALRALNVTKEALKSRSEFRFDSGDAANLEGGIAMLRVILALQLEGFSNIALVTPPKDASGADFAGERNGYKVCFEVKAITKQSSGKPALLIEDQLYPKLQEYIPRARKQLQATSAILGDAVKILVFVVNWFDQSVYLDLKDYQGLVNNLEKDGVLIGIDGLMFITKAGQRFWFLNENEKRLNL